MNTSLVAMQNADDAFKKLDRLNDEMVEAEGEHAKIALSAKFRFPRDGVKVLGLNYDVQCTPRGNLLRWELRTKLVQHSF